MFISGAQMQAIQDTAAVAPTARQYRKVAQSPTLLTIPGALLRLDTLGELCGRSRASLDRDIRAGKLKVVKPSTNCTRVRSEDAQAYLQALAGATS